MSEAPELFDLYDAAGHALDRAKARDAVHRDGDWHRSAHIWIYTSAGRLLFQRRAPDKDTWPSRLDASVGGHYRAGEGLAGVVREADEESARLHAGTIEQAVAEVLPGGATTTETRTITSADFIPGRSEYLAALARAVSDVLAGRPPQALEGPAPGTG